MGFQLSTVFGVHREPVILGQFSSLVSTYCISPEITLVLCNLKYFHSGTVTVEDLVYGTCIVSLK